MPKTNFLNQATVRTTALWACSEAFLGGILFALKVPMSGIVLATFASICITVIALTSHARGAILKATLLVIAVKFALSPHSPIMAYLAVLVQGLAGELFFLSRKKIKLSAFATSFFALLYSAFQHLLVLWILFGIGFYEALNQFLHKITQSFLPEQNDMVAYIILFYILAYVLAGIVAGLLNIQIVRKIKSRNIPDYVKLAQTTGEMLEMPQNRKRKWYKKYTLFFALFSVMLLAVSYLPDMEKQLAQNKLLYVLLRSFLIVLVWIYTLTPFLRWLIRVYIRRKNIANSSDFKIVLELLPEMRLLISKSWKAGYSPNKWTHVKQFITSCFLLTIFYE